MDFSIVSLSQSKKLTIHHPSSFLTMMCESSTGTSTCAALHIYTYGFLWDYSYRAVMIVYKIQILKETSHISCLPYSCTSRGETEVKQSKTNFDCGGVKCESKSSISRFLIFHRLASSITTNANSIFYSMKRLRVLLLHEERILVPLQVIHIILLS